MVINFAAKLKKQLRMHQRIENMPKACPYAMVFSVLRYWIMNFNYLKRL